METHQREMKVLQDRLQLEIEEHVKKMKRMHAQYVNAPQRQPITDKQVCCAKIAVSAYAVKSS